MTDKVDISEMKLGEVEHFTFLRLVDISLWTRVKMAVSMLLTPLTLVLMGRSIRVTYKRKRF